MKKHIALCILGIFLLGSWVSCIPNNSGQEPDFTTDSSIENCNCRGLSKNDQIAFNNYYNVMSSPIDCKQLTRTQPSIPLSDTPDEFNWRDNEGVDWTTPAKHQGNCGSCWGFFPLFTIVRHDSHLLFNMLRTTVF
jgi:C1A family cysteine protease